MYVVDDDPLALRGLGSLLRAESTFKVATFGSPLAALRAAAQRAPDLVLCDLHMQDSTVPPCWRACASATPTWSASILTSVGDVNGRARAVAEVGALGQADKPLDRRELLLKAAAALERRRLAAELAAASSELERREPRAGGLARPGRADRRRAAR